MEAAEAVKLFRLAAACQRAVSDVSHAQFQMVSGQLYSAQGYRYYSEFVY